MAKKVIICTHGFSNDIYKVGSHHYACQLSKLGYDVLVISTPISIFHFINLFKKSKRNRFLLKFFSSMKGVYRTAFSYQEYIPFSLFPYIGFLFFFRKYLINKQNKLIPFFYKRLLKLNFIDIDYLIIENPIFNFMTNAILYKKLFYRATDIYPDFSDKRTSIFEKDIVYKSNSVIVTSSYLKDYLCDYRRGKSAIKLIENGVDSEFYLSERTVDLTKRRRLLEILEEQTLQVVYVGAIDERFDCEVIEQLVSYYPKYNFHFFGIVSNYKFNLAIANKFNCFFWGPIEYDSLPYILKKCHVGLLPFICNNINDSRSPMKLYEYGICGLTVIATRTADLEKKNEPFVILCTKEEFVTSLENEKLIEKPYINKAIHSSSLHSWENNCISLINIMTHA